MLQLKEHPFPFKVLLFCETLERFAYYGMKSSLMLYMVDLLISKAIKTLWAQDLVLSMTSHGDPVSRGKVAEIFGLVFAMFYLTPLLGGWVADRLLKRENAILLGGILMSFGYFAMSVESLLFPSLGVLCIGHGLYKPNITSSIAPLYPQGDPRLSKAFSIFYLGICTGAFVGPIASAGIGQAFGWRIGFWITGIAMALSTAIFLLIKSQIGAEYSDNPKDEPAQNLKQIPKTTVPIIVSVLLINSLFWTLFELQSSTIQLIVHESFDWSFLGYIFPTTTFQAFGAFCILFLIPLSFKLPWLVRINDLKKMSFSFVLVAVAFFYFSFLLLNPYPKFEYLLLFSFFFTIGEILNGPVQLKFISEYSPGGLKSTFMGLCFLSAALGSFISGKLGNYYFENKSIGSLFTVCFILCFIGSTLLFLVSKIIERIEVDKKVQTQT